MSPIAFVALVEVFDIPHFIITDEGVAGSVFGFTEIVEIGKQRAFNPLGCSHLGFTLRQFAGVDESALDGLV